jgi:hypothetical protein
VSEDLERRRGSLDLLDVVSTLTATVGDLKVAVGELKITIGNLTQRDGEDRALAREVAKDVDELKLWRSRIKGQLALLWLILGAVLGTVVGRMLHIVP